MEEEEEGEIVNTEPEEGSQLSQDEGQELVLLCFFLLFIWKFLIKDLNTLFIHAASQRLNLWDEMTERKSQPGRHVYWLIEDVSIYT